MHTSGCFKQTSFISNIYRARYSPKKRKEKWNYCLLCVAMIISNESKHMRRYSPSIQFECAFSRFVLVVVYTARSIQPNRKYSIPSCIYCWWRWARARFIILCDGGSHGTKSKTWTDFLFGKMIILTKKQDNLLIFDWIMLELNALLLEIAFSTP